MAGLLGENYEDPKTQGILGFALQMLANSGGAPRRRTAGEIIGASGLGGMEQYNRQRVMNEKLQSEALDRQLQQLKIQQLKDEIAAPVELSRFFSDKGNMFREVARPAEGDPYGEFQAVDQVPLSNREQLQRMMVSGNPALQKIAGLAMAKNITGSSDLPKDVQSAEWYRNATPEQRAAYAITRRGFQMIDGVPFTTDPSTGEFVPVVDPKIVAELKKFNAYNSALGSGYGRARTTKYEGTDPQGNPIVTNEAAVLGLPTPQNPYALPGARLPSAGPSGRGQAPMPGPSGQPSPTEADARALIAGSGLPSDIPAVPPVRPLKASEPTIAGQTEKEVQRERYDADMRKAQPKARASIKLVEYNADQMIAQIDELKKHPGVPLITGIPSNLRLTSFARGTQANDAAAKLDVLLNKIVVETIKELKSLSATGSTAFGQLSEREGDRLEQNRTALKEGMTTGGFMSSLDELKKIVMDTKALGREAYNYEFGRYERERAAESPADDPNRARLNEMRKEVGLPPL